MYVLLHNFTLIFRKIHVPFCYSIWNLQTQNVIMTLGYKKYKLFWTQNKESDFGLFKVIRTLHLINDLQVEGQRFCLSNCFLFLSKCKTGSQLLLLFIYTKDYAYGYEQLLMLWLYSHWKAHLKAELHS